MDIFLHCLLVLFMVRSTSSLLIPREVPVDVGLEGASSVVLRFPRVPEDEILGNLFVASDPRELNPCTRTDDDSWISMFCENFRLGNALMIYWNIRAAAALDQLDFFMESNRTDLVSKFPSTVKKEEVKPYLTESHLKLYEHLKQLGSPCWNCIFPHCNSYAPWRIMGDMIFKDTRSVVERVIESSPAATKEATSWAQRQNWAVFHFRCDLTIFKNEQYGFLPYRFITKALPRGTTTLLIVGQIQDTFRCKAEWDSKWCAEQQGRCSALLNDLVDFLRRREGIAVELQQASVEDDWLTLATAPILICSSSTYCFTAAMGNPNHVYFPMNGMSMGIPADGEEISGAQELRSPNFRWVETDYMPGPLADEKETSWETVQEYLRSDDCTEEQRQHCVAIGGSMPERFRFHNCK